jgi:SAM-dependent methyltransferase
MKWLLKAALQKALSGLPAGRTVNHLFQRQVSRTLPIDDARLRRKVRRAANHFEAFRAHVTTRAASDAVFYEFGAGWDLVVPLVFYSLGVDRQVVVDRAENVRLELVNDALTRLNARRGGFERSLGVSLRPLGGELPSLADLEDRLGIEYLAPRDASNTGLPAGSVHFVSSTSTLEHVPEPDILAVLVECRRLLRPGGIISSLVDMRDHHAYFDDSVSPHNFLKFSSRTWRLINSSLNYQNRLRHPDYIRLFEQAGFEILVEKTVAPTDAQLATLRGMALADEFRGRYSLEELGARSLHVVARAPEPTR